MDRKLLILKQFRISQPNGDVVYGLGSGSIDVDTRPVFIDSQRYLLVPSWLLGLF
jgi:hypothetical protein